MTTGQVFDLDGLARTDLTGRVMRKRGVDFLRWHVRGQSRAVARVMSEGGDHLINSAEKEVVCGPRVGNAQKLPENGVGVPERLDSFPASPSFIK